MVRLSTCKKNKTAAPKRKKSWRPLALVRLSTYNEKNNKRVHKKADEGDRLGRLVHLRHEKEDTRLHNEEQKTALGQGWSTPLARRTARARAPRRGRRSGGAPSWLCRGTPGRDEQLARDHPRDHPRDHHEITRDHTRSPQDVPAQPEMTRDDPK